MISIGMAMDGPPTPQAIEHGEGAADDRAEVRDVVGQPGDEAEGRGQRHADDERADEDHAAVEQTRRWCSRRCSPRKKRALFASMS